MLLCHRPFVAASSRLRRIGWLVLTLALSWAALVNGMSEVDRLALKQDARYVFYHGWSNYLRYAYPEDELRPLSCAPLTRDRANPAHIEVNDVLGNYSLSVVDSLSTLAILASSPTSAHDKHNSLVDFQRAIGLVINLYGDGTEGPGGQGTRARGFDLDSKVQLFETTIRGLGGLLSAHQFAIGDLPIRDYKPELTAQEDATLGIVWHTSGGKDGKFVYNGQLLRLAYDLGKRLLPAFHTPTGLPYPRINLRHGTPFYENSPLNNDAEHGQCETTQVPKTAREITETCSAGAGSLVLEFATLSRLTGDDRFEQLAKRAFWAVWERRSASGLIGAGIDAETGQWAFPYTGIGAGIDSFFEYAFKSHVLLSGLPKRPEDAAGDTSDDFLQAWEDAHSAISRHIYRGPHFQHPHYAQNDLYTGGPRFAWIDSLSAYYPGLLTLAGEVEEAATTHLLYTALWSRYGALPERWNSITGRIDGGLRWWGGRPEFIESTWYLYRATHDPWYLHVGEMTLKDIKRRCYTKCGWAGLQDVQTGEQTDRMESFFLGETAKYLYLLFDDDHPLNTWDAPYVFTTEGHPLIIPRRLRNQPQSVSTNSTRVSPTLSQIHTPGLCPRSPGLLPFGLSSVAARPDFFHAAALARLHNMPLRNSSGSAILDFAADHPSINIEDVQSPSNYTYYPWTLPLYLVADNGTSAKMASKQTFDLTFPMLPNYAPSFGSLQRLDNGILVNSLSGLRLGLVLDEDPTKSDELWYRVYSLSNLALGRDEIIYLNSEVMAQINPADPHFTRVRDREAVDLIVDASAPPRTQSLPLQTDAMLPDIDANTLDKSFLDFLTGTTLDVDMDTVMGGVGAGEHILSALPKVLFADGERLAQHLESLADLILPTLNMDSAFREAAQVLRERQFTYERHPPDPIPHQELEKIVRYTVPAMLPTGIGAAALPLAIDSAPDATTLNMGGLPYQTIFQLDDDLCNNRLPNNVATRYNILVVRRGGCSFSDKIANIPSFAPSPRALQLVIIISFPEHEDDISGSGKAFNIRPLLDKPQLTPAGVERRNPVAVVMVSGGYDVWDVFERAASTKGRFRDGNLVQEVLGRQVAQGGGLGVNRRYSFTSQGIRISNLIVR